jgi:hypothetical protein
MVREISVVTINFRDDRVVHRPGYEPGEHSTTPVWTSHWYQTAVRYESVTAAMKLFCLLSVAEHAVRSETDDTMLPSSNLH